ncbi:trimethyllysine dioxygenase [Malassezia psittaci]|uniref:trimethyllysine dioxygenase n=1 Tax=Malassezia psittaci TaxID=1821823 RepID=A0AAF0F5A6_9BASI|nr:trimethyllysine dioxygenase [Malassezia psittaci]
MWGRYLSRSERVFAKVLLGRASGKSLLSGANLKSRRASFQYAQIQPVRYATTQSLGRSAIPSVQSQDRVIHISWPDGEKYAFHLLWLLDHCRCDKCYHPITKQRLVDTFSIPTECNPILYTSEEGLHVEWSDAHRSFYPWSWLRRNQYKSPSSSDKLTFRTSGIDDGSNSYTKHIWGADIATLRPTVSFKDVMESESAMLNWLDKIDRYGFCFVSEVPITREATEQLVRRIAFIRETHYGGFWDFTSNMAHGDTAYTSLALGAHTDTTYFTDPAGLQLFHLLHHHSSSPTNFVDRYTGSKLGGSSLLVDGFYVAQQMHQHHPKLYNTLRRTRFRGISAGDDSTMIAPLMSGYSILEHDPVTDALVMIRYNNSDRSSFQVPTDQVEEVYEALRTWNSILTDPKSEYWFQLQPGTAVIFDNHRILHGRSEFSTQHFEA